MAKYPVKYDYLTPNKYSRPQKSIPTPKGIVIHWVANPNTTAQGNRNFFENRKNGTSGYGSAHEFIDLDGTVLVCVPANEMCYHVGSKTYTKEALSKLSSYPNNCTYGIEATHIDWDGKMTDKTYESMVLRVAELCQLWNLDPFEDLWLHKEVVGWKDCHRWFVNNPAEWKKFKQNVYNQIHKDVNKKVDELIMKLSTWQLKASKEAVDSLAKKGLIDKPEEWKKKLANDPEQIIKDFPWLIWLMLDRISK